MCQFSIHTSSKAVGVFSFTTGFIASPKQTPRSENDILAHALWLERHGYEVEAIEFLERYCDGK